MEAGRRQAGNLNGAVLAIAVLAGLFFVLVELTGSGSDAEISKTLSTALALLFFTILGSLGVALIRLQPRFALLGLVATTLALLAFGASVVSIWNNGSFGFGFGLGGTSSKVGGVTFILAIAASGACALLMTARPDDRGDVRLVRFAGIGALALFAGLAIVVIVDSAIHISGRAFAIVATVYVIAGALLLVLRLLQGDEHSAPSTESVAGVDHLVIAVSDRPRADRFYRDVLGAEVVPVAEGRVAYRFGGQRLNVHQPGVEASPLAEVPVRPGGTDLCLIWTGTAASALERLRQAGVEASGPVPRTGAGGKGTSVYCRDPDGSLIELISYSR